MENSLLNQYKKQWKWKSWNQAYSFLPEIKNSLVYDIGCAHGDHSEKLASLGATVIGLDGDKELLKYAKQRKIMQTSFLECDLTQVDKMNLTHGDGVWMSFVSAYFTDFKSQLERISSILRPGGWIAITEMSGLFDHSPLEEKYQSKIKEFYKQMYMSNSYDFYSGAKIKEYLHKANYDVKAETIQNDSELSKQGACSEDVILAWTERLGRMKGLHRFMGDDYLEFKDKFLNCLRDINHTSNCKVHFYFAAKK